MRNRLGSSNLLGYVDYCTIGCMIHHAYGCCLVMGTLRGRVSWAIGWVLAPPLVRGMTLKIVDISFSIKLICQCNRFQTQWTLWPRACSFYIVSVVHFHGLMKSSLTAFKTYMSWTTVICQVHTWVQCLAKIDILCRL